MEKLIITLLTAVLFVSCTNSRFVKPLEEKESAITFGFGGPLAKIKKVDIPLPLSAISYGYGYQKDMTLFATLHTIAALFGVIQTDAGMVYNLSEQSNLVPAFSVSPYANFMLDCWEGSFKFYPAFDLNAYWSFKKDYVYVGSSNWFELASKKAHDEKVENHWLASFHTGYNYSTDFMDYNLEMKYLVPFISNENKVVEYVSFSKSGAVGIYFSIMKRF